MDKNNKKIPRKVMEDYLITSFESSRTYGLFTAYFDAELYQYAKTYYENHLFARYRLMYAVLGIAEVLERVEASRRLLKLGAKNLLERDFAKIHNAAQIPEKFKPYVTARIDIKLMTSAGDMQILSVSDEKANVDKPDWFQKNGVGYVIRSYAGDLEIVAKASADGQIRLTLRGRDVRNPEDKTKRIPYWIDYTTLTVNDKVVFDERTPAWHDKGYDYNFNVKGGEEIKIKVEWLPHR